MSEKLIHLHIDRSYSQTIPEDLRSEIALQLGGIDQNRAKIAFCGFVFKSKEAYVFLPRGSDIKNTNLSAIELARLLFQCIAKYCRTSESFLQKEGRPTIVGKPQILPLIVEILNDYKANGIYSSNNVFNRKGFQGKTDWKKTINSISPHVDDEDLIYPQLINRFTNSFFFNETTKIHYSILQSIQTRFGWLLPELEQFAFVHNIGFRNQLADIGVIKAELSKIYSDSKIHTLKTLLRFLEDDLDSGKSDSVSYGFSDFQYVWEDMLRHVLGPTHTFEDMPVPAYQELSGRMLRKNQKGQRIDIFLYEPDTKKACVVDAKYYDGSTVDNAPGWPDLVKQFFYAKSLKAGNVKYQVSSVENYFIFPGVAVDVSPEIAFVVDSSGRLDSEFPPIKCVHINPERIIKSYISGTPLNDLRAQLFK